MHTSALYNGFQIGVNALAIFTTAASSTMKCFVAGTLVLTAMGLVAIENIKAGDRVIATDVDTFETAEKTVLETYIRRTTELADLTINGELIRTTPDHPFYVKDVGFVPAGKRYIGDKLLDSAGKILVLEEYKFENAAEPTVVYNFQVEDFHTYYVGSNCVIVHNAKNYNNYDPYEDLPKKEKIGKQHGNAPKSNKAQNKQFKYVADKFNLDNAERKILHEEISRQGYGKKKILDTIEELFGKWKGK